MCTQASGRPVKPCWDPWPAVYDFQAKSDNSINPPPEPLPSRYMLDDIFSAGTFNNVTGNTTAAYANAPKAAPPDAVRMQAFLKMQFQSAVKSAIDFTAYQNSLNQNQTPAFLTYVNPADYDGTFVPSNSVRENLPANAGDELANVGIDTQTGENIFAAPQWAIQKGV